MNEDEYLFSWLIELTFVFFFADSFFIMPGVAKDNVPATQGSTTMYQITSGNSDGEYTDQELLNLVNYFEVSRVELKNVRK